MNLRTLMRCGDVTRWHIVRTARQQTLAEHLYKTWLMAGELHSLIGLPEETRSQTLEWALTHDQPEVLMGDLPTPTKRVMEQRTGDPEIWHKLERDIMADTDKTSDDFMQKMIAGTPTQYVVKIADNLEGWHFLTVEAVGPHARDSERILLTRASVVAAQAAARWPEFQWVAGVTGIVDLLTNGKIEHVGM